MLQAGQKLHDNLKKEQAASAASKLRKAIESSKADGMSSQVRAGHLALSMLLSSGC